LNKPKFRQPALFSSVETCILTKTTDIAPQMLVYPTLKHLTRLEACEGFTGFMHIVPKVNIQ
jgi:hypothetical protein